ncbi:arginine N-succinyltransferase [Neptunomonas marina]|uniref:Arginine N-succinyltransferase n=1 Tax=Neptunomonas marina TaxID=1815562 RepID=A0A437QCW2_9GAMM|nr:arginine N-succinyltransferase [Neptunomonas marina]RVU32366.1 arginine N-succinyltransferase [Neptunomonas marina]
MDHSRVHTGEPVGATSKRSLFLIIFFAALCGTLVAFLLIKWVMSANDTKPLSPQEQQVLSDKFRVIGISYSASADAGATLEPAPYTEKGAVRTVTFTERELNGMIAESPEWAGKLSIDLSDHLASARLAIPLDPDFPLLGGKTLHVHTGLDIRYQNGAPSVKIVGVSLWGVPLPNAWLGELKNKDLVQEYRHEQGFWHGFAQGVEEIAVQEGELYVKLKP